MSVFDYKGRRPVLDCTGDPGRTKQSMKKECDINRILGRFWKTGAIDHFAKYGPKYGDFTGPQFQEAMNVVVEAEQMFMALPSEVRSRFGHDPAKFLEFVQDPKNAEDMKKMGLAKARDVPRGPIEVRVVNPEPAPAPPA